MTVSIVHFGVKRLYVFELTDPTVGAPVYDTGVRLRAVRRVGFEREVAESMLEGDDEIVRVDRQNKALNFTFEHGLVPLDVIALLCGATLEEDAGPPVTSKLKVGLADRSIEFGWIAKVLGKDGGTAHIAGFRAKEQGGGYVEAVQDEYGTSSWTGKSLSSPEDEDMLYQIFHVEGDDVDVSTTWATNEVTVPAV